MDERNGRSSAETALRQGRLCDLSPFVVRAVRKERKGRKEASDSFWDFCFVQSQAQALAAGCMGVFQNTSYISIGDPGYVSCGYSNYIVVNYIGTCDTRCMVPRTDPLLTRVLCGYVYKQAVKCVPPLSVIMSQPVSTDVPTCTPIYMHGEANYNCPFHMMVLAMVYPVILTLCRHQTPNRKPLMYGQKEKDRSCYGGKQMMTNPAKDGRLPDTYFDKKYSWISYVCSITSSFAKSFQMC
eukprot:463224-Pyramimonas_sp.AAC.1